MLSFTDHWALPYDLNRPQALLSGQIWMMEAVGLREVDYEYAGLYSEEFLSQLVPSEAASRSLCL